MRSNRNVWAALCAAVVVVVALIFGFLSLGAPRMQRLIQADNKRTESLLALAYQVNSKWNASNHVLPARLEGPIASSLRDPVTQAPYDYHVKEANRYELCATFARDNRKDAHNGSNVYWSHPQGYFCFVLDPSEPLAPIQRDFSY